MSDAARLAALAEYPVVVALPIQWGDQDAFGHVNNTLPLRWFETSRVKLLEQCGLGHLMAGEGLGPIVASITCNYRRQVAYPDTVHIATRIEEIGPARLILTHAVYSEAQQAVTTDGQTVIVFFDYRAQRPRRVPDDVRAKLRALQPGA
jgi:acyl-CoA thioester hydrolase